MVIFILAWPDATLDEIATFVYNQGGELFSRPAMSKRFADLEITTKAAATDAYQSQTEEVQFRLQTFFNMPRPMGICGEPRYKLIDVDEFGITLEKLNRTRGWALKVHRVRKDGHYHHGAKLTCLLAIEPGDPRVPAHINGSIEWPRRWCLVTRNIGTTATVFGNFTNMICTDIETNPIPQTDEDRIFIWDNLISHHSAYVHQIVTGRPGPRRFSIVARPQYHPKIAPIEYKICDLTNADGKEKEEDWDMATLEQEIARHANLIGPFDSTFHHCGYRWVLDANNNVVYQ